MAISTPGHEFLSANKAANLDEKAFWDIKKFIVLWPRKHPKSELSISDERLIPPKGDVIGFDQLGSRL